MTTQGELEARLAQLEQRLHELEAEQREFGLVPILRQIFPPETRKHLRAAQREQLLALRSLLDRWIEQTAEDRPARRRESIRIE